MSLPEDFYKLVFQHSTRPICIYRAEYPEYIIVDCNETYNQTTNTVREELLGRNAFEVFSPEDASSTNFKVVENALKNASENLEKVKLPVIRYDIPGADGTLTQRWWEAEITPFQDANSQTYLMIVSHDITNAVIGEERITGLQENAQKLNEELAVVNEELMATNDELNLWKKQLEDLNASLELKVDERTTELEKAKKETELERDRLKRFIMDAPAAITITSGPDMVYELINPAAKQFYPDLDLLGKKLLDVFPEMEEQPIFQVLQNVYKTGEPFIGNEVLVPLPDYPGGPFKDRYFNFTYQPRFNADKQVDGILSLAFEVTDIINAKKRIEASGKELKNLVMTAHYALMILRGRDFVIEVANQGIASMWDKELDSVLGKKLMDVLPELEGQPFPALLRQVYDSGVGYGQEEEVFHLETEDGPITKYVSFYYDPLMDEDNNVCGIIVAANDVTNLVRSRELVRESNEEHQALNEELATTNEELAATNEELNCSNEELLSINEELVLTKNELEESVSNLAKSESRFREMVRNAPVAISVIRGEELLIESANKKMLEILSKDRSIVGMTAEEVLPGEENQPFFDLLREVMRTGNAFNGTEMPAKLQKNGEIVDAYYNYIYQPVTDETGKSTSVITVAIDVTDQVMSKKKLKESEENFRMLADNMSQLAWITDETGYIFWYNQRWFDYTGTTLEEMKGWGWSKVHHPDYLEEVTQRWITHLKRGEVWEDTFPLKREDGEFRWFLSRAVPVKDEKGNIVRWFGTNTDVTVQRELVQLKDDFISIASHELKTPITSLKASIQLLDKIKDRPTEKLFPTLISQASRSLEKVNILIHDLLSASKVTNGHIHLNKTWFKLSDAVKEACDFIYMESSHQIITSGDLDLMCYADKDRIGQIITNFVNNAIKYAPDSPEIKVVIEKVDNGKSVKLSVIDKGQGIPEDKVPHLFERYFRVDNSGIQYSGLGLGLYICNEIISKHNGKIGVVSQLNEGSTFWFSLPDARKEK